MNFTEELKRAIKRADVIALYGEPKRVRQQPARILLYSLIKIQDGKRSVVGCGMTEDEAKTLSHVLTRKMKMLPDADESGGPLFEITLSAIEKEL